MHSYCKDRSLPSDVTPFFFCINLNTAWSNLPYIQNSNGFSRCVEMCPPRSPDLSPCDCFLWGYGSRFCFRHGHSATDTFAKLQLAYGDSVFSRAQAFRFSVFCLCNLHLSLNPAMRKT
ncbi:hypothetical protein NQ318_014866 [Aromia moschata]|uniref:Uncharacterized protein n=1 Tax=Aromia moschata TaxID=1265417 RepID=A0AAV8XAV6_9CUCU|nr:hypothetical protein NQ318_014866 [Aromia moschata]